MKCSKIASNDNRIAFLLACFAIAALPLRFSTCGLSTLGSGPSVKVDAMRENYVAHYNYAVKAKEYKKCSCC